MKPTPISKYVKKQEEKTTMLLGGLFISILLLAILVTIAYCSR